MNGAMTTLGTPATITADSHTTTESALNIDSGKIVAEAVSHFSVLDYSFFVVILSLSALIGVYYGYFSKHKQNTTSEYILAGRSMSILPVATSLIATHISGNTLLALPTEVYSNGTQYVAFVFAAISVGLALAYIYLPLFHNIQVTSSFEYLERRFDRRIRLMASVVYVFTHVTFTSLVIFVPALAFSKVSGSNLHFITPIICLICIFYTTIGGLRAVVWTDFIQFVLMLAAIIAFIILGAMEVGGFSNVWAAAERGGRLIVFDMDPSPFARTSFWTVSLGLTVLWNASSGVGQTTVQRFLAVPDLKAGRRSVVVFIIGMIIIKFLALFIGLCIYAKYEHCDPVLSGQVTKSDEIVPHYVVQVGRKLPGLAGLFIAGIFSAGLSTMSSSLNTLCGTIYEDFIKGNKKRTEQEASNIMKWIAVILGVIVTGLVFLVEKLGPVFQVSVQISGVAQGAFLAIFTIGMVSRSANTKGLICGVIASLSLVSIILIGAQMHDVSKAPTLIMQSDECPSHLMSHVKRDLNATDFSFDNTPQLNTDNVKPEEEIFWLFRISFMYYSVIGFVTCIVVAQVVSLITGGASQQIDESLLTPLFQSKAFKEQMMKKENEARYTTIDQMLIEMTKLNKDSIAEEANEHKDHTLDNAEEKMLQ